MAEQQQNALTSAFPSPPNFYTHFTPSNIASMAAIRESHIESASQDTSKTQSQDATALPPIIANLPEELKYLQPPPPPKGGLYRSFGDVFNVCSSLLLPPSFTQPLPLFKWILTVHQLNDKLPTLSEQGIEQLYTPSPSGTASPSSSQPLTHTNKALIIKRLAKSLLLNFLEFMGILSTNPEQYQEKLQDLRTLFINFHHLLNEYRPHQAREQVILLMEKEVERVRSEREGLENMKVRIDGIMKELGKPKAVIPEVPRFEDEKAKQVEEQEKYEQGIWEELVKDYGGRRESGAGYWEDDEHWKHDRGWAGGQYPHD